MKQYVEYNITKKSMATIEYVLKMASSIMETIIFMFMGLTTVSEQQTWNTGFVLVTLISCLVYRAIGSLLLKPRRKTHRGDLRFRSSPLCQSRQSTSAARVESYRYVDHVLRWTAWSIGICFGSGFEWTINHSKERIYHRCNGSCPLHGFHSGQLHRCMGIELSFVVSLGDNLGTFGAPT